MQDSPALFAPLIALLLSSHCQPKLFQQLCTLSSIPIIRFNLAFESVVKEKIGAQPDIRSEARLKTDQADLMPLHYLTIIIKVIFLIRHHKGN